jgi:outer membrane lipoprotein carrier protein
MKSLIVMTSLALTLGATELRPLLQAVEQRYNSATTLEVRFEQRALVQGRPRRAESGLLTLRKPGRMRWQYTQPAGKLFICDGKWVWFYTPDAQQVERAPLKQADDFRAPLAFLLGRLDFSKLFSQIELREAAGESVLVARPKSDRLPYSRVEFTITAGHVIRRLLVAGVDGTDMEFLFTGEKLNTPQADTQFRFTPPPGVAVVDATEER